MTVATPERIGCRLPRGLPYRGHVWLWEVPRSHSTGHNVALTFVRFSSASSYACHRNVSPVLSQQVPCTPLYVELLWRRGGMQFVVAPEQSSFPAGDGETVISRVCTTSGYGYIVNANL